MADPDRAVARRGINPFHRAPIGKISSKIVLEGADDLPNRGCLGINYTASVVSLNALASCEYLSTKSKEISSRIPIIKTEIREVNFGNIIAPGRIEGGVYAVVVRTVGLVCIT